MDGLAIQLGQAACETVSILGALRGRCGDLTTMRVMGYCVFGTRVPVQLHCGARRLRNVVAADIGRATRSDYYDAMLELGEGPKPRLRAAVPYSIHLVGSGSDHRVFSATGAMSAMIRGIASRSSRARKPTWP